MRKKPILILIIIGLVIYFNSFFNQFLWDDEEMIASFSLSLPIDKSYFRPIMSMIYFFLFILSKGDPVPFRLFQVMIHLANTVLLLFLFNNFLNHVTLSFFLSLIFLVHPVNSEAVLFISATQEPLFVFFSLIGLLVFSAKKNLTDKRLLISSGLILAGFFVKETAVVFLVIMMIYLMLFQKKWTGKFFLTALLMIWLYGLFRLITGSFYVKEGGLYPIMRVSIRERILTIPQIVFYYLKQFFFPLQLAISQHFVVKDPNLNQFWLPLIIVLVFLGILLTIGLKIKNRLFVFFFGWFLIGLFPHLQIIPLNMTAAERWFYLPEIGLLGMLGIIILWLRNYLINLFKKKEVRFCFYFAVCFFIIILSLRTIIRSFDWRSGFLLFSRDIKITQETFDLNNNYGVELFRAGKITQAKKYFERSIKMAPYWWVNWNNLGAVYEKKGDLKMAEMCYRRSIGNGDYYLAYENLIAVLIKQKKITEAKELLETKALIKFPKNQKLIQYYQSLLKPLD